MKKLDPADFANFIGIDISRNKFDYALIQNGNILAEGSVINDESGSLEMCENLKKIKGYDFHNSLFCMEATGIYSYKLLSFLEKKKAVIVVEHPVKIKNASGLFKNKSDKLDAIMIGAYARRFVDQLQVWEPKRQIIFQLQHLLSLRNRFVMLQKALKTPLSEQLIFLSNESALQQSKFTKQTLKTLKAEIKSIEKFITQLVKKDKVTCDQMSIMMSIPGIGIITALQILISTNEFKDFTCPKKFASYAGIAPLLKESGSKKFRSRVAKHANIKIKALLTTAAFSAIRYAPELKSYYERKTKDEKKNKMLVINAIRYKLLLRVFCCVANGRCYQKDYHTQS